MGTRALAVCATHTPRTANTTAPLNQRITPPPSHERGTTTTPADLPDRNWRKTKRPGRVGGLRGAYLVVTIFDTARTARQPHVVAWRAGIRGAPGCSPVRRVVPGG